VEGFLTPLAHCSTASGPGDAIGLPAKDWFASRDIQSTAFLSPSGIEKLCSGAPPAARISVGYVAISGQIVSRS
jgi:hypothetical protein